MINESTFVKISVVAVAAADALLNCDICSEVRIKCYDNYVGQLCMTCFR